VSQGKNKRKGIRSREYNSLRALSNIDPTDADLLEDLDEELLQNREPFHKRKPHNESQN